MARKLTFEYLDTSDTLKTVVIPEESEVYYRNKKMWWVLFNNIVVWRKNISNDTPLNLTASKNLIGRITVNWNPVNTGEVPRYYKLYRDGTLYKTNLRNTYFEDTGLGEGVRHEYCATAQYDYAESDCSNTDYGLTKIISGWASYTNDATFIVPDAIYRIKVCVQAAGNGGFARVNYYTHGNTYTHAGGGKAGFTKSWYINVVPGQKFKVTIGDAGRRSGCWVQDPGRGEKTTFGGYVAWPRPFEYYYGQGKVQNASYCRVTPKRDGTKICKGYGGQGTIYGEGGNAGCWTQRVHAGCAGGFGAGGGGQWNEDYSRAKDPRNWYSTRGYQGFVHVGWGKYINTYKNASTAAEFVQNLSIDDINKVHEEKDQGEMNRLLSLTNKEDLTKELNARVAVDDPDFDINIFSQYIPQSFEREDDDKYKQAFI